MSVGLYADTCRHVSRYFACNFQFGCCALRLDRCVRRKKLKVVRFGVSIAVFRCQFSVSSLLSIADGGTAFLSNVGTTQTQRHCSTSQNAWRFASAEPDRCSLQWGVLLLHTCSLSSYVQPCNVFCTSLKLCVPPTEFVIRMVCCLRVVLSVYIPSYVRTCWMTNMENGSYQHPNKSLSLQPHISHCDIDTIFVPWSFREACMPIYIYMLYWFIDIAKSHGYYIYHQVWRGTMLHYVLSGTCKVCERSDVVGSHNTSTAKRRVCRHWNGVTLHVLDFIKNWKIEFGCHSKERNGKKRKSGSSVVEYSSSLVNMLAVFDIWSVNLQSWLKAFLVLLFVGALNQTKPTLCPFMLPGFLFYAN